MTREERAITNLKQMCSDGRYLGSGSHIPLEVLEDFSTAIKALEQEPTTKNDLAVDCISRKSVIEEMEKRHAEGDYITKGFINSLPSVTPIRPKGHWKAKGFHTVYCDNCNYEIDIMKTDNHLLANLKFCPSCGADMREVEE